MKKTDNITFKEKSEGELDAIKNKLVESCKGYDLKNDKLLKEAFGDKYEECEIEHVEIDEIHERCKKICFDNMRELYSDFYNRPVSGNEETKDNIKSIKEFVLDIYYRETLKLARVIGVKTKNDVELEEEIDLCKKLISYEYMKVNNGEFGAKNYEASLLEALFIKLKTFEKVRKELSKLPLT